MFLNRSNDGLCKWLSVLFLDNGLCEGMRVREKEGEGEREGGREGGGREGEREREGGGRTYIVS